MTQGPPPPLRRAAWLLQWGIVLVVVVGALIVIVQMLLGKRVSAEGVEGWVAGFGTAAPIAFIVIFTLIGSLLIPTTLLTIVAATLFGRSAGFGYSMTGAFCAAMLGFFAARRLGREAVSRWIGKRTGPLAKLDKRLETRGFSTALLMRLLYIPNGLINIVCGLSRIRAASYALATAVGLLPMVFAVTFVTAGAKVALLSGDWSALLETETILAVALFLACLTVPFISGAVHHRLSARKLLSAPYAEIEEVFEEEAIDGGDRALEGPAATKSADAFDRTESSP